MSSSPRIAAGVACLACVTGMVAGGITASGAPIAATLRVTAISPTAGPLGGGNQVTLRVAGAAAVRSVDFGGVNSTEITHLGREALRVTVPAHAAGAVDVTVHSPSGTSAHSAADRYRFAPAPALLQLSVSGRLGSRNAVGHLAAIGCTVRDFCAVQMTSGDVRTAALITFGRGHRRSFQPLPGKPFLASLLACGTPTFCVAGNRQDVRIWNGHRWGGATRLAHTGYDRLLACAPGTRRCVLAANHDTLVHGRHGWRTARFPHGFSRPTSLSCATPRFCLAVEAGRTARFDGTSWHEEGTRPHFAAKIGCASAHDCLAVGKHRAAVFDGRAWHAVPTPPVRAAVRAVSCVTPGRCVASTTRYAQTFAGGQWTTSRVPPGRRVAAFACSPHGICRATVGRGQTLRLVGGHWTRTENITAYHDELTDVSCASKSWCMAVGRSGEAFRYSAGHWTREGHIDGRRPLVAITCTADRVCVAVDAATGTKRAGASSGGGAVRYAHGTWHRRVVIDTGHPLTDVSCPTAERCVAVDRDGRAVSYRHGRWSTPARLAHGTQHGFRITLSIDCPTSRYCVTAGTPSYELINGNWRPIAGLVDARGVDCVDATYCVFGDYAGIEVRHEGLLGSAYSDCCDGAVAISCPVRSFCAGVYDDEDPEVGFDTRTYLLHGAAVRREPKLSIFHSPGPPTGIACFVGPVCIGVTAERGFTGN